MSRLGKHTKQCAPCRKSGAARFRKGYQKNPARVKLNIKRWRVRNPDAYKRASRRSKRAYMKKNPAAKARANRRYRKNQPARSSISAAAYRARRMQATPRWVDKAAIASIYELAQQERALTGNNVTVDHTVPLKHALVCGLHVPWNLMLVHHGYNSRKRNNTWPDMP